MSELKAKQAYFSEDEYERGSHKICAKVSDCGYDEKNDWWSYAFEDEVYLKSEADKVIAEKDAEIEKLKAIRKVHIEAIESMGAGLLQDAEEIRHQKYKRCLAMAERCKYRMYYLAAVVEQEASKIIPLKAQIQRYEKLERRMDYWKNRWLELAEKFKPNKEAK